MLCLRQVEPGSDRFDRSAASTGRRRPAALIVSAAAIYVREDRRDAEHVRDIVESIARIVGRQQGRFDVEREQVVDGVLYRSS